MSLTALGLLWGGSQLINLFTNQTGREQARQQEKWAHRHWERDAAWRSEDLAMANRWRDEDKATAQQWRDEDIERNSLSHRVAEARSEGFHPSMALAGSGLGGGGGGAMPAGKQAPMTQSGGRMPRPSRGIDMESALQAASVGGELEIARSTAELNSANAKLAETQADVMKQQNIRDNERLIYDIKEINSRIESSNWMDRLTEQQRNLVREEFIKVARDNRLHARDGNIVVSDTNTLEGLLVDLHRAGLDKSEIINVIRSLEVGVLGAAWNDVQEVVEDVMDGLQSGLEARHRGQEAMLDTLRRGREPQRANQPPAHMQTPNWRR